MPRLPTRKKAVASKSKKRTRKMGGIDEHFNSAKFDNPAVKRGAAKKKTRKTTGKVTRSTTKKTKSTATKKKKPTNTGLRKPTKSEMTAWQKYQDDYARRYDDAMRSTGVSPSAPL